MRQIDKLTSDAQQNYILVGEAGELINFTLRYLPRVLSWMIDISYKDFVSNGFVMTVSPNILHNYRNILPFGILVTSEDDLDPLYQNDFISGRIKVYLLNNADKLATEQGVFE